MSNYCSHCGTQLTEQNKRELEISAFLELGEYDNDSMAYDWENGQQLFVCGSCNTVNMSHEYLPSLDESNELEGADQ